MRQFARPAGAFQGAGECLDLCTSDEEEVAPAAAVAPPLAKRKASELNAHDTPSEKFIGKRPAAAVASSSAAAASSSAAAASSSAAAAAALDSDDDEVCMEVEAPVAPAPMTTGGGGSAANDDDDDDLQFVGRTGKNALSDFPHSRENCLESPWKGNERKACPNW